MPIVLTLNWQRAIRYTVVVAARDMRVVPTGREWLKEAAVVATIWLIPPEAGLVGTVAEVVVIPAIAEVVIVPEAGSKHTTPDTSQSPAVREIEVTFTVVESAVATALGQF